MRFTNEFDASYAISEMAEDIWHNRSKLVTDAPLFVSYRVSVSQYDPVEIDHNFFFHVVFTRDRWFYMVSDNSPYDVTAEEIMVYEHEYRDTTGINWNERGESYRHYMFRDCFQPAIKAKIEAVNATMENPGRPYLWNTLPIETLRTRAKEMTSVA